MENSQISSTAPNISVPPANGSLEEAARKPKTCKEPDRSQEVSSKHLRPASQSYPAGVMSGSKEEIESADVGTCMGDCIPSPASGCWMVQVVSSTVQKTQQRSMSTLERCPQWWAAKWIPQAGEQQLEASLKDKPPAWLKSGGGWCQKILLVGWGRLNGPRFSTETPITAAQERQKPGSTAAGKICAITSHHTPVFCHGLLALSPDAQGALCC